jgi:hypothetical protein
MPSSTASKGAAVTAALNLVEIFIVDLFLDQASLVVLNVVATDDQVLARPWQA